MEILLLILNSPLTLLFLLRVCFAPKHNCKYGIVSPKTQNCWSTGLFHPKHKIVEVRDCFTQDTKLLKYGIVSPKTQSLIHYPTRSDQKYVAITRRTNCNKYNKNTVALEYVYLYDVNSLKSKFLLSYFYKLYLIIKTWPHKRVPHPHIGWLRNSLQSGERAAVQVARTFSAL